MSLVPVSRTIKETGTHDQLVDPTSYAVDQTPGESSSVQGVLRLPLQTSPRAVCRGNAKTFSAEMGKSREIRVISKDMAVALK